MSLVVNKEMQFQISFKIYLLKSIRSFQCLILIEVLDLKILFKDNLNWIVNWKINNGNGFSIQFYYNGECQ